MTEGLKQIVLVDDVIMVGKVISFEIISAIKRTYMQVSDVVIHILRCAATEAS